MVPSGQAVPTLHPCLCLLCSALVFTWQHTQYQIHIPSCTAVTSLHHVSCVVTMLVCCVQGRLSHGLQLQLLCTGQCSTCTSAWRHDSMHATWRHTWMVFTTVLLQRTSVQRLRTATHQWRASGQHMYCTRMTTFRGTIIMMMTSSDIRHDHDVTVTVLESIPTYVCAFAAGGLCCAQCNLAVLRAAA